MARKNRNAGAAPLTSPQTREEIYLANIAGLVATKPAYPYTRTERYLDAISSGTSGLAARVTALETGKVNTLGKGDNLLINSHFYRPINQRGIAPDTWISATDPATYNFIDMWKITSGRAKFTSAGVVLEGTMTQKLEFAPIGDVIASALTTEGYVTPVYDTETRTFSITGSGETLVAAKLERGTVQTLYSGNTLLDCAPEFAGELVKCQRYFESNIEWQAIVDSNGFYRNTIPYKVTKAKAAIPYIGDAVYWNGTMWADATSNVSAAALDNKPEYGCVIAVTGLPAGVIFTVQIVARTD